MLIFCLVVTACSTTQPQKIENVSNSERESNLIEGTWNGAIKVPENPLDIIVKFKQGEKEKVTGTISIPIQNVEELVLDGVSLEGDKIEFNVSLAGQDIRFNGSIKGNQISGTFTQSGLSVPFVLKKSDDSENPEEKETFLTIETSQGPLYGSLILPDKKGPVPIALIIPGSGTTDRNGNLSGYPGKNNSLKLLAEGLAGQGIASIRYDKRGAGRNVQSMGKEEDMRFDQFISDAKEWIEKLEKDERFTDIIVIGHSQGSLVGMIAAKGSAADAFISIAGAGRPLNEILLEQLKTLPDDLYKEGQEILNNLNRGKMVEDVSPELASLFRQQVQPFLISWMQYSPQQEIRDLDIPVLIVQGDNDIQVPVMDAKKLKESKLESESLIIAGMNHVLKEAPEDRKGNLNTYSNPNLPLAKKLLPGISNFLQNEVLLD